MRHDGAASSGSSIEPPRPVLANWLFLACLLGGSGAAFAEQLACPAREEQSRCVPGLVASRVVCAGSEAIVEHESVTAYCLSCHKSNEVRAELEEAVVAPQMTRLHPMEVEYPSRGKTHRPIDELYQGIRLANGRVTCLSCHGGRGAVRHYLSTHPREPNLCVHCHLK
jgi:hypothetical protein